ncbi:MAG: AIR synthase related protein, partial [Acidobacteriaceae bacterium]
MKRSRIPGELALVESIRRRAASTRSTSLVAGIGDDCAVLRAKHGYEICVTTDFSLEDRHFRRHLHPPQSVGHRCLARGLSDLAAMGADPLAVFLSLALPARLPAAWLDGFLDGFLALAGKHRVPLAGGDTAESPGPICADIVALGQLPCGQARLRSAARSGDFLYVTGSLGGSAAELLALARDPKKFRALTRD